MTLGPRRVDGYYVLASKKNIFYDRNAHTRARKVIWTNFLRLYLSWFLLHLILSFIGTSTVTSARCWAISWQILITFVPTFTGRRENALSGWKVGWFAQTQVARNLPVFRANVGIDAFETVVVENLSLHASQLFDVLGKVASDELLTAFRMWEAWVSQRLAVRTQSLFLRASESSNVVFLKNECNFEIKIDFKSLV